MPDIREPGWLFNSSKTLEDFTFKSIRKNSYTLHLTDITGWTVYDDFNLEPIDSDIAVHVQKHRDDDDLFFTLDPNFLEGDKSYTSTELADESQGCSIIMKRDYDSSECDLCGKEVPRGTSIMAFTGGEKSSEMHCSCWSELITSVQEELKSDSSLAVSRMI